MAKPNPRALIPIALVAVLLAGGWYVERQRAQDRSTLSGFFESQPTQVASRIGGRVAAIKVREGDVVKAGDLLVVLETKPAAAETDAKEAQADQAQATAADVRNGPRPEEIRRQEAAVAEAAANLERLRNGARPEEIEQAGAEGELARREVGRLAYEINVQQYACAGLNFGTYYDRSPIIAYDGSKHPAYTMNSYAPSTVPGCRTPHLWCADGGSLYDAMGPEFTLLRLDSAADVAGLAAAARHRGVPLKILDIEPPDTAIFYGGGLVLSRPDQHVAWRGDRLPTDPLALIDRVRGASNPRVRSGYSSLAAIDSIKDTS